MLLEHERKYGALMSREMGKPIRGAADVILNLKYGARDAGEVLDEIGSEVLPRLAAHQTEITT